MIQAEVIHPSTLSPDDVALWRGFCAAELAFANPLLGPDFAKLVGEVREDARVAVFRRDGRTVGFLAFHKRPNGFARPIGSAFSDYHALITAPGETLDVPQALATAGIGAYAYSALIDPRHAFTGAVPSALTGYVLRIQPTAEAGAAYLQALKDANPKRLKNWNRLRNKLEREWGEIELTPGDTSQEAFELLIDWKRDQYRRTGAQDMMRPAWAQALFQRTFERRDSELRGVMTTLRAGGKLVAGHFGPAMDGYWHGWISSMDPECAACGPGFVLMTLMPDAMRALSLSVYDMAPGHEHYKAPFATAALQVMEGTAKAKGAASLAARSLDGVWAMAGQGRIDAVSRLRRRLDHIAAAELSMAGRMRGLAEAIVGYGRRAATRDVGRDRVSQDA